MGPELSVNVNAVKMLGMVSPVQTHKIIFSIKIRLKKSDLVVNFKKGFNLY